MPQSVLFSELDLSIDTISKLLRDEKQDERLIKGEEFSFEGFFRTMLVLRAVEVFGFHQVV